MMVAFPPTIQPYYIELWKHVSAETFHVIVESPDDHDDVIHILFEPRKGKRVCFYIIEKVGLNINQRLFALFF